jgi:hypothetical protein
MWRNPPNIRNRNAPVTLENKISCGLNFLCASSFRPSHKSIILKSRQVSHPCDAYSDGYQSHSDAERRPSGGATNLRRGRTISSRYRDGFLKLLRSPGIDSNDNPITTRFLAPIDCSKILAQYRNPCYRKPKLWILILILILEAN